jgi:multiple sugar transport system permease protein
MSRPTADATSRSFGASQRARRGLALTLTHIVLLAAASLTLVPFFWLVCGSFKTNQEFLESTFLPRGEGPMGIAWSRLTTENFSRLFTDPDIAIAKSLLNSVFYSSVTAVLATLFCAMGGYALAHYKFRGSKTVTALVLAAVIVPGPLLLAPGYQLLHTLGMLDTAMGLILPALAPAFGVFLFRQATISSVPTELLEAARIDGSSEVGLFFRMVLPLVRPMIGTFLMITFLGVWNNFIQPQVVLQTRSLFPLSVAVAELKRGYYAEYGLQMAGTLLSIVPVMGLFLLLQRELVSGLTSGAVKE